MKSYLRKRFYHLPMQLIAWRTRNISNKNFLILASIIVGIIAGLAAVFLKSLVHFIEGLAAGFGDTSNENYVFFIFPAIGILLTTCYVQFFRNGKLGRGLSNILYSIARKNGRVHRDKTYSHIISSALTVGFGGSAGLEAPIAVTGSAIGSVSATFLGLSNRERILLLACGTAAGVSAIFNSPIAGVIFAVEVLLPEMTVSAFIPLIISSATAAVLSRALHNQQLFHLITDGWEPESVPLYIVLGIFCGLVSVYITRMTHKTEEWIGKNKSIWKKAIAGGFVLGALIFILPPLYGEGYGTIDHLLNGRYENLLDNSLFYDLKNYPWFLLLFGGVLILVKVFATSITIACGGNGGIFATSLMTGALCGFFCVYSANLTGIVSFNETNFIATGMAGILSGVVHAPLTAIFLIAEITGGYVLFAPLMIVSALAYFTARFFEPHTVYTKKLAEKGVLTDKDKDKAVLRKMGLRRTLEKDFLPVKPNQCLGEIIPVISKSKRNIFPVLDEKDILVGLLSLNQIREIMFKTDMYDKIHVYQIMEKSFPVVEIGEEMVNVVRKFEDYHVFNIPVTEKGVYKGFISKSNIFTTYRNLLIKESEPLSSL
ncbi:chloride channel protein [Cytophagaceae bacterium ABcell3]|nr:chloride channel protein [Cytophagaceae bacterium ABcell3]